MGFVENYGLADRIDMQITETFVFNLIMKQQMSLKDSNRLQNARNLFVYFFEPFRARRGNTIEWTSAPYLLLVSEWLWL